VAGEGAARGKFANRIVGTANVDPAKLKANPANWRTHDATQREAIREILGAVGWVQRVIVNKRTGHVLDGHMRVEEALKEFEPTVPVVYVDLSVAEERRVLTLLDPVGTRAGVDKAKLRALLDGAKGDGPGTAALIAALREKVGGGGDASERPEVEFTEELLETHQYVVLYTDNEIDWLNLQSRCPLEERKSLRSEGKFQQVGVARVMRWADVIRKIDATRGTT
jgi:hypothetical protein